MRNMIAQTNPASFWVIKVTIIDQHLFSAIRINLSTIERFCYSKPFPNPVMVGPEKPFLQTVD